MQQIKEHGKNTQGQTNEEIGSLPEKERIQSNDSKDDPAFLKMKWRHRQTGDTDQEDIRNV